MSSKNKIKFFRRISFKITLWYSLSVVLIITIVGFFLYYLLQYEINKSYESPENFKKNILILIPVVVVITIIGGFIIARRSLAPLGYIIKSAKTITASKLNTRLESPSTGDELEELTNTINLMLNRLEESFMLIVRFTSDISHELRTPIATLKTGTEVVLAKDREAAEYRELLENNLSEFEKITRLIEDLLVILRADSGNASLNVESFNLSKILKELGNTFGLIAEAEKINFIINKMNDVQIKGDKKLLCRVFSNLFDNAIKYTLPDGHIYVTLDERDDVVSVIVKDTGIGISEDHKGKIFNRFFRSDLSRSRDTGSFGLGLSICKHIVELHKGQIEVKSKLGSGSSFKVTLHRNIFNI